MSGERQSGGIESEKGETEFEFISKIARENLLEQGFHPTTILIFGSRGATIGQFASMADTHQERMQTMFSVGCDMAQHMELGSLERVYLISEAWMAKANPEGNIPQLPSQDPNRQEILLISNIDLQNGKKQNMAIFEMVRDENERICETRVVDDPPDSGTENRMESPLLEAFVSGYRQSFSGFN